MCRTLPAVWEIPIRAPFRELRHRYELVSRANAAGRDIRLGRFGPWRSGCPSTVGGSSARSVRRPSGDRHRERALFDEIQDKSRQLAEASQHKSQFLANMSHELRTPLNAIIGVPRCCGRMPRRLKQDIEPLDRVLGAARHLLALINDILDLSKIEAGRMELQLESFSLAPLITDVVKTIEPIASAKNANRSR